MSKKIEKDRKRRRRTVTEDEIKRTKEQMRK
jgi:hypothetical protein